MFTYLIGNLKIELYLILSKRLQRTYHSIDYIQKRFQHGNPVGKRNVLGERQDVVEITDISLASRKGGRPFQVKGPVTAKARH